MKRQACGRPWLIQCLTALCFISLLPFLQTCAHVFAEACCFDSAYTDGYPLPRRLSTSPEFAAASLAWRGGEEERKRKRKSGGRQGGISRIASGLKGCSCTPLLRSATSLSLACHRVCMPKRQHSVHRCRRAWGVGGRRGRGEWATMKFERPTRHLPAPTTERTSVLVLSNSN